MGLEGRGGTWGICRQGLGFGHVDPPPGNISLGLVGLGVFGCFLKRSWVGSGEWLGVCLCNRRNVTGRGGTGLGFGHVDPPPRNIFRGFVGLWVLAGRVWEARSSVDSGSGWGMLGVCLCNRRNVTG